MKYAALLGWMLLATTAGAQSPTLRFDAPKEWASGPSTAMRAAQYSLPRAAGDTEDAELILYYFGGSGGSVESNLERWLGQIEQPDGRSSKAVAKTSTLTANGLKITVLDVSGRYVAEVAPGAPARHNKAGFRLKAAVVETAKGPYFVKLTGPAKTIARWDAAFDLFLRSAAYR
ncbi:MAG: hypothetical protein ACT4QD_17355 [Acidobacteriota bacterium]